MARQRQRTISVPKTDRRSGRGFTLLELVVTLFIVSLFVGSAFSLTYSKSRKDTAKFAAELEVFVRNTKISAQDLEISMFLHFHPEEIYRSLSFEEEETENLESLKIPSDCWIEVETENRWIKVSKKSPYVHLFSRSGIIEPFTIRIISDEAEFRYTFDGLTSAPAETKP